MPVFENHIPEGGASGTLVCLTGVNSGAYLMQGAVAAMGHEWQVLRMNTPGVDGMPLPIPFTPKAYAKKVLEILDKEGVQQFVLLGHSLGGYAAQELARMVPERVQKLILVSTSRGQPDTAIDVALMQKKLGMPFWEFQKLMAQNDAKGHEPLFGPDFAHREPLVYRAFLELRRAFLPASSVSLAHLSAGGMFSSAAWVKRLKMPTLVVHGTADILVSARSGRKLADALPQTQWLELFDVGHFPMLEYAGFWDKVRQFVEGVNLGQPAEPKDGFLQKLWNGLWFSG